MLEGRGKQELLEERVIAATDSPPPLPCDESMTK